MTAIEWHEKAGTAQIASCALRLSHTDADGRRFYGCPWCGPDCGHFATVAPDALPMGYPLHCHISGHMAWVDGNGAESLETAVRTLRSALNPLAPLAKELCALWHSKGVPLELIEEELEACPDLFAAFRVAVEEHKATGAKGRKSFALYEPQ